jgi:hypothetical protein
MEGPQPKESKRCLSIHRVPKLLRPREIGVSSLSRNRTAKQQGASPATRRQEAARQDVQRQDIARLVDRLYRIHVRYSN